MNEEQLQAIEERRNRADMTTVYEAVRNWDNGTANDAYFAEWAGDDITALIAEVRALRSKLDATPTDAIRAIYDSVPVNNWTRAPLKAIRQWLASLGKQVSL